MNFSAKIFSISILFVLLQGCDYFNTTTITKKQIKEQSEWNDKDQAPSFEDCADLKGDENMDCFKGIINENLTNVLSQYSFISTNVLNEEIVLTLEVDTDGSFSLNDIDDEADVLDQIESLSDVLETAVSSLPQALPAVKTNVGAKVKTQLKLPIRIVASPQE